MLSILSNIIECTHDTKGETLQRYNTIIMENKLLAIYILNIFTLRYGALQLLSVDVRNKLSMNFVLKNKRIQLV